ncbi:hypothetical protein ACS0TY_014136 [Phlomoides rotata]
MGKFDGGLGVRDLELFNKVLLWKWGWRFLNEGDKLWARIIRSRYGEVWGDGFELFPIGRSGRVSLWWREVLRVIREGNEDGFGGCLEKVMGDGGSTYFWEENWMGEGRLCELFPRLYHNSLDRGIKVKVL